MTVGQAADALLIIGALGLVEFGALLVSVKLASAMATGRLGADNVASLLGRLRWRCAIRAVHFAPVLLAISVALLITGAIMRSTTA
jgi:hypothetical protein